MSAWLQTLVGVMLPLILGFLGWQVRLLFALRTEVKLVNVTLFGQTGNNGLNGEVKSLREDRHQHQTWLGEHRLRLDVLEEEVDRLREVKG